MTACNTAQMRLAGGGQPGIYKSTGITACTGTTLSTSGGTSDGRFLAKLAREVVEFGPLNDSIHKIDEHVRVADLEPLSAIYERAVRAIWRKSG